MLFTNYFQIMSLRDSIASGCSSELFICKMKFWMMMLSTHPWLTVLKLQNGWVWTQILKVLCQGVARILQRSCSERHYICYQNAPPSVSLQSPLPKDLLGLSLWRVIVKKIDSQHLQNHFVFLLCIGLCSDWNRGKLPENNALPGPEKTMVSFFFSESYTKHFKIFIIVLCFILFVKIDLTCVHKCKL